MLSLEPLLALALLTASPTEPVTTRVPERPAQAVDERRLAPWELGFAAGAGWESDVDRFDGAPSPSGYALARAWITRRFDLGDDDAVWLALNWSGQRYAEATAFDQHRPQLSLEWGHALGPWLVLRTIGFAGWRALTDSAASGWDAGARALLRLGGDRKGVRLGLGFTHRSARDPALAYDVGRLEAGGDLAAWRGATLVLRYTAERLLSSASSTGDGAASSTGLLPDASGAYVEPVDASTAHLVGLELVQRLGARTTAFVGWTLALDPASSPAASHGVSLELAFEL